MNKKYVLGSVIAILLIGVVACSALAASYNSQVWLAADSANPTVKLFEVAEGATVHIVVSDSSFGEDDDSADTMSAKILLYDVKTGAYLFSVQTTSDTATLNFTETGKNTDIYVSDESFHIGARNTSASDADQWTHTPGDLTGGDWLYTEDGQTRDEIGTAAWNPDDGKGIGRIENKDSLIVTYIDPVQDKDVSTSYVKINDTVSTVVWSSEVFNDPNEWGKVTITDEDENLDCNEVEAVPVFFLVNPGYLGTQTESQTDSFCAFKHDIQDGSNTPLRWYNIYTGDTGNSWNEELVAGQLGDFTGPSGSSDDPDQIYIGMAQETGANTGVFELEIDPLKTMGSNDASLANYDSLVAYYLDPNDFDDFSLAVAYINESPIASDFFVAFTDSDHNSVDEYQLIEDRIYIEVADAAANTTCEVDKPNLHLCDVHEEDDFELDVLLEETAGGSGFFNLLTAMKLRPVWSGDGVPTNNGGYQLETENGIFEAFNEDSIYVRYNNADDYTLIGFDLVKIYDYQSQLQFIDSSGNAVTQYASTGSAYIQVIDYDQNEDADEEDTIRPYWDGANNKPFGPGWTTSTQNMYLADSAPEVANAFGTDSDISQRYTSTPTGAKIYLWNPGNGKWASAALIETGKNTGVFTSSAVGLGTECVNGLDAGIGDSVFAIYQDPSNHSDVSIAMIKVGSVLEVSAVSVSFINATGTSVDSYAVDTLVYVKVVDSSHPGSSSLKVTVEDELYDLTQPDWADDNYTYWTEALTMAELGVSEGDTINAEYQDETDTAVVGTAETAGADDISVSPNPFSDEVTFEFATGTGAVSTFDVTVYDLRGHIVWEETSSDGEEITWDGTSGGADLANGPYLYVVTVDDDYKKGMVFINRNS